MNGSFSLIVKDQQYCCPAIDRKVGELNIFFIITFDGKNQRGG